VSTSALEQELDDKVSRLPGAERGAALRRTALARFGEIGVPTPRRENWRYTDLKRVAAGSFEFAPSAPGRQSLDAARVLLATRALDEGALRLVFLDGHEVPELSRLPEGPELQVASLATAWETVQSESFDRIPVETHPLASLNTAFGQGGAWIRVPARARPVETLHLVFIASERSGLAPQPRILVELGEGAALNVVEHWLGDGDRPGWINSVSQLTLAAGSALSLYRVQEHGASQTHTALVSADVGARAALQIGFVDLGGRLVRNDIEVKLTAPGATVDLFGALLAAGDQHVDDHTRIDHLAPETRSDESFRGIIGHRGHGVFNGKVVVHRGAQKTDARQSNDNLLLADQAEIDTKPELEIYADDVKCSHGSTVGELDAEQLFYLRARGVAETQARELLTIAFANAVLERIPLPELRTAIAERVTARLHSIIEELP
jgi:Fe-S cluster assembly protein SufD